MANPDIGHTKCPVCETDDVPVRINKNQKFYISCPFCPGMYTPLGAAQQEKLKRNMKRIPVETPTPFEPQPVKRGFLDEFFGETSN